MSQIWRRAAALVALVIGIMAVVAGGKVLLGIDPGYYVIAWVPVYNYTVGVLTAAVTSVLLWRGHRLAQPLTYLTLAAHLTVLVVLLVAYRGVVASESITAMAVRVTVWVVVLGLVLVQSRRERQSPRRLGSVSLGKR